VLVKIGLKITFLAGFVNITNVIKTLPKVNQSCRLKSLPSIYTKTAKNGFFVTLKNAIKPAYIAAYAILKKARP